MKKQREILFKGKRLDNGEWIYGYYVKDPQGKHRIYLKPFEDATSNTYYFVNPETVCQFSGSVDRNGIKIFEDDIAYLEKGFSPRHRPIVYTNYGSWYIGHIGISFGQMKADGFVHCEIVGNIHDNPELLIS
jgi:hypothetical protein